MRILFFTTALEHTTFRKTAEMLQKEGATIKMLGFTRNNFPVSSYNGLEIHSFGCISHGNYFSRIIKLLKIIPLFYKEAKKSDVIYNFTLDTLILSRLFLLFRRKIWVYQIQDIRSVFFGRSLKNRIFRRLEKRFINRMDLVVVSSINFYTGFFKKHYNLSEDKVIVIENKVRQFQDKKVKNIDVKKIKNTIGYFGVMRCRQSWLILKKIAEHNPDKVGLYLRGKPVAMPEIETEIKGIDNITFDGMYKSPEDLQDIYSRVDVVWAAYPYSKASDGNWKYARTIRFYEALAFGKPVIVQKGTPQEQDVVEKNIGIVVDMGDIEGTIQSLLSIKQTDIQQWEENIKILPSSYYVHTDEYSRLLTVINEQI